MVESKLHHRNSLGVRFTQQRRAGLYFFLHDPSFLKRRALPDSGINRSSLFYFGYSFS